MIKKTAISILKIITTTKTYRPIFLDDLATLEKTGITHPDFAKVRALLK